MSEHEKPTVGDEDASEVDESGRNLTQQRLDEEPDTSAPADASWADADADADAEEPGPS